MLINTRVDRNTGDLATVVDANGTSWVEINDSVIVGNGQPGLPGKDDLVLFRIFGIDTVLHLNNSTMSSNTVTWGIVGNDNARIHINATLWHEQPSIPLFPLPQLSDNLGEYNMTSQPLPGTMASAIVADPGFINPAGGDLRRRADSPAADRCIHSEPSSGPYGFVGQRRNVRLRPESPLWMDVGAHESLVGERLFPDGFFQPYD